MPEFLDTPEFQNEQEETAWWDSPKGRAVLLQGFQQSQQDGTLRRGTSYELPCPRSIRNGWDERLQATLAPGQG